MKSSSRRLAGILAVAAIGGVIPFVIKSDPPSDTGDALAARGEDKTPPDRAAAAAPAVNATKADGAAGDSAPVSSGEILVSDRGMTRRFHLCLDEAAGTDGDGRDVTVRIEPPATAETLGSRLAELSAEHGDLRPVCYEPGKPRTVAYRRILTRDITVRLPSDDADPVLPAGITLKERPPYAPGFAVVSAEDPLAALAALDRLRDSPGIVSADLQLAAQRARRALPNDPLISNQWHLKNDNVDRTHVSVEDAWRYDDTGGVKGTGIRIGIVDDGVQTNHPDFVGNIDTENDFDWNGNDTIPNPGSGDDHGTACAGNAAARGNNGTGVAGAAPEGVIVGMRLIAGATTDSMEADALGYLPELIQIKSNSWGPFDDGSTLEAPGPLTQAAIAHAAATGRGGLGTIFTWAGGNGRDEADDSNKDGYANDIHTIAVGAIDNRGDQSWYSESGANLVVVAPSSGGSLDITTVDRTGSNGYSSGDYTNDFGGTSSATPTVAGVIALMLEKNPGLGWRDVQEILIRSAYQFRPSDGDWTTNSAGYHFNHKFGAGLVDATAAVALSDGWTNLEPATSQSITDAGINFDLADNSTTGVTRPFEFSGPNLRVEHVTVSLSATHTKRGDLAVTLISPSGMTSRLAVRHRDDGNNYNNWTFSSVRHWGENSTGTWRVHVADVTPSNSGRVDDITVTFHGVAAAPINPGPVVRITSPENGTAYSPGVTIPVTIEASDLDMDGNAGTVTGVQLLANGTPVGTDASEPYEFSFSPENGTHVLTAVATDSEGKESTSPPVNVDVFDQPPVITAARLDPSPHAFTDEPVVVTGIVSSDPEGQPVTYLHAWEKSADGVNWSSAGITTAALPPSPSNTGLLWRCRISATDGNSTGPVFTTEPVNGLTRPSTTAPLGQPYSYDSDLVLRGIESPLGRDVIINEFSQGGDGTSEWVEILVLRETSMRAWTLNDSSGNALTFADTAAWDAIQPGTLVVIYSGDSKDSLLPADDTDASDGTLVLSSSDASRFAGTWPVYPNNGGAVILRDAASADVAGISYGTSNTVSPNVGAVEAGSAAYYAGAGDVAVNDNAYWAVTTSQVARHVSRDAGDLFISEYVDGTGNNNALEIFNPSPTAVDMGAAGYRIELYLNGASSTTRFISLLGTIPAGGTWVVKHVNASTAIPHNQTSQSNIEFNGDDALVLRKGGATGAVVDSIGQVGVDPGTAWISNGISTSQSTLRRKPSILAGDTNANNSFNPSLEWDSYGLDVVSDLGRHQVDGLEPGLSLSLAPAAFSENAGENASTLTVSLTFASVVDVLVSLESSDPMVVSVPATVLIPAGQPSVTVPISAIDDAFADGPQTVDISAVADDYDLVSVSVTVTDDETALEGVTPAGGNNAANSAFVADLRSGAFDTQAEFRFGSASQTPAGLLINSATGLISGELSGPEGSYLIEIERFNSLDEIVTQSFILNVGDVAGYQAWIAAYPGLAGFERTDDPDGDGLENLLEYHLGSQPDAYDATSVLPEFATSGGSVTLTWWRATDASDTTAVVEWSDELVTWSEEEISLQRIDSQDGREQWQATLPVAEGTERRFLRLRVE